MYIRDNKETETEFREMRESNDKLQKELQHEKSERQILSTTNLDMRTQIESLNLKLTSLETTMKNLETQVEELNGDVEVHVNDKSVLEAEMKRFENEKNEMALDLVSVKDAKDKIGNYF